MVTIHTIRVSEAENVTEPVTLEDAKAFMNVDFTDDDALITALIKAARKTISKRTNRLLVPSAVVLDVETGYGEEPVYLPYATVASAFVLTDLEYDAEILAADEYKAANGTLRVGYKGRYGVSYTETPVVEEDLKEAIKMLVAYRYNNRGDQAKQHGIPEDVQRIIEQNWKVCL